MVAKLQTLKLKIKSVQIGKILSYFSICLHSALTKHCDVYFFV